jgi:hypothetical protein
MSYHCCWYKCVLCVKTFYTLRVEKTICNLQSTSEFSKTDLALNNILLQHKVAVSLLLLPELFPLLVEG